MAKATVPQVKEYFAASGKPLSNAEIIELKKSDPKAYDQIANGIGDGTLTY